MARILANKTNVDAPAGFYPYGRIRNNPGNGTGTPVNELLYGDIHQAFQILFGLGGVVPNDLPENSSNGFQFAQCFQNIPKTQNDFTHIVGNPLQPPYQNSFGTTSYGGMNGAKYRFTDRTSEVILIGGFQRATESNGTTVFTLPLGYRPQFSKVFPILMRNNSTYRNGVLLIDAATGNVSVNCDAGDAATTAVYFIDGITFPTNDF